uniref:DNA methyltransferase n=1 Tax=Psychrobacter sp. T6-1 TaxID=3457447 RepID=UPI003FD14379
MPIKYVPYTPNTIEGQAILDNITRSKRVLSYRDNNTVYNRIKRGMPYYEVETIEQVGKPSDNIVLRGECISACAYLKEQNIKVDLVYIDPPFASGADYAKKVYIRKNPKLAQKVAEAEAELEVEGLKAFEETMYGDIWNKEDYLNWMYENLQAIKSIMSENAAIYMHLDWHIGHYVKILMDEVFGEECFINEIIWAYRSGGASKKASIARKHDCIYFYCNNRDLFEINTIKERQYLEKKFIGTLQDEDGRFYVDTILTDTLSGVIHRVLDNGHIKDYSCRPVLNVSKERLDYATQKPEGLVDLLLEIASQKGMTVADFFGGSGVTAKVANELGRNFIHCDVGINSIQTVRDRLVEESANFKIVEVKDGVNLFRNPQQTMDKLATLIRGLQRKVEGVSKFWLGAINDSKIGIVPVYVPDLIDSKQKLLDIPTINLIINQEIPDLEITVKKVIVYYIDIDDEKALTDFIKENNVTTVDVELKDLKNLLHETVVDDEVEYSISKNDEAYSVKINRFFSDRLDTTIGEFNEKGRLQSLKNGKEFNSIEISEEGLELIELISLDCKNKDGEWFSSTEIKIDKLGYVIKDGEKTKEFWDGQITSSKKPLRIKVRNISGDELIEEIV